MNPADIPRELVTATPAEALLAAVRAVALGPLAQQVEAIDRQGRYPREVLQQLGQLGAMSAHLDSETGAGDYGLAIQAMAEVSRVCGCHRLHDVVPGGLRPLHAAIGQPGLDGRSLAAPHQRRGSGWHGAIQPDEELCAD